MPAAPTAAAVRGAATDGQGAGKGRRGGREDRSKGSGQDTKGRVKRARKLWSEPLGRYFHGHEDRFLNDETYRSQCGASGIGQRLTIHLSDGRTMAADDWPMATGTARPG